MDRERVSRDQSVLVEHGSILAIGVHLDVPPGASLMDTERYIFRWVSPICTCTQRRAGT
ncbi:MAG TPA: hypothetical protein VGI90_16700 [Steroidobacteraceae bacterium]|jgi:hypothetical protein